MIGIGNLIEITRAIGAASPIEATSVIGATIAA